MESGNMPRRCGPFPIYHFPFTMGAAGCSAASIGKITYSGTYMPSRAGDRKPDQLRPVRITRGYTRHAEGSVLVEFGDTRVLCTASVLDKQPPHLKGQSRGWVTAEYGMLPRATNTRGDR